MYIFVKIHSDKDPYLAEQTRKMEEELSMLITQTLSTSFKEASPGLVVISVGLMVFGVGIIIGFTIRGMLRIIEKRIKPKNVNADNMANVEKVEGGIL